MLNLQKNINQLSAGDRPLVIARGGFSGLFPESCQYANLVGVQQSLSGSALFCNLQQSKDGVGFCHTDIRLDNITNIATIYPKSQKTYKVNGQDLTGWYPMDFTSEQLFSNVTSKANLVLNVYSSRFSMVYLDSD